MAPSHIVPISKEQQLAPHVHTRICKCCEMARNAGVARDDEGEGQEENKKDKRKKRKKMDGEEI